MGYLKIVSIQSLAVVLGATMFVGSAQAARTLKVETAATTWGCKLAEDKVKQGLRMALIGRSWTVKNKGPGKLEGSINVRNKHKLSVDISYNSSSFTINYKGSENLNYEKRDDGIYIHKNGVSWIGNVRNDAVSHLSGMCN